MYKIDYLKCAIKLNTNSKKMEHFISVKVNGQIWFLFSFEILIITGLKKKGGCCVRKKRAYISSVKSRHILPRNF